MRRGRERLLTMGKIWIVGLSGGAEVPYVEKGKYTGEEHRWYETSFAFTSEDAAIEFAKERTHVEGGNNYCEHETYFGEDPRSHARKEASVLEYALDPVPDGEGGYKW